MTDMFSRHGHMPLMAAVMSPFPWHIDHRASVSEARSMMEEHGVHHLPVMVDGYVDSVISDRDLKRASLPGHSQSDTELQVGDLCPPRAYIADVGDPLDKILEVMAKTHIGSVIVTREGELAGIFTEVDTCRWFTRCLRELYPPAEDIVA
jgi:acetoin utilization protein AcuB